MPEKDPTTYSVITYLWFFGVSALGRITSSQAQMIALYPGGIRR